MTSLPNRHQSTSKFGNLHRRMLAARTLMSYQFPIHFKIEPFVRRSHQGFPYEVYESQKTFRKTILMIYGFTIAGEREARLMRFAQSFAAAGFRVVVPILPGIKSINIQMDDLAILINIMTELQHESDRSVGIVGFSVGGGLALIAAADPALNCAMDPIILLGPYYSLPDIWASLWRKDVHSPATDHEWNDFIWQQMILAYRSHHTLDFSPKELEELTNLLMVYCFETSLTRKMEAYEQLVKPHGLFDPCSIPVDMNVLEKLSPCNKLGKLQSRVLIIHDPHDPLSPVTQSSEMITELQKRGDKNKQYLLISSMFSHISPGGILNIPDLISTIDIFGILFSD